MSCALYHRTCDFELELPINIASYSFLTHLIANHCGLEAYELIHFMGNCYIYESHLESIKLQITQNPVEFPTVTIKKVRENINDYILQDFDIHNYIFI